MRRAHAAGYGIHGHSPRIGCGIRPSIYEPFGIAQVEPISFGGLCVFTSLCGCAGFVRHAAGGETENAMAVDYTVSAEIKAERIDEFLHMDRKTRDLVESAVAGGIADEIFRRLPRKPVHFEANLQQGYALARRMSWEVVARDYVLPGIDRAIANARTKSYSVGGVAG